MFKNLAIWLVIGMVLMTVFNQFNTRQVATGSIEYSQFIEEVKQGRISKVAIEGRTLKATTTEGLGFTQNRYWQFKRLADDLERVRELAAQAADTGPLSSRQLLSLGVQTQVLTTQADARLQHLPGRHQQAVAEGRPRRVGLFAGWGRYPVVIAEALRAQGCDEIQGYYFSRPLPVPELEAWARQHQPSGAPVRARWSRACRSPGRRRTRAWRRSTTTRSTRSASSSRGRGRSSTPCTS